MHGIMGAIGEREIDAWYHGSYRGDGCMVSWPQYLYRSKHS